MLQLVLGRWRFRRSLSPFLAVAALVLAISAASGPAASQKDTATSLNGHFIFWRTSKIATPVTGRIEALPKRVGEEVKKGEVVAKIDTRQLEADLAIATQAVNRARADLVSAEARLAVETSEFDRVARLKASPAFNRARFEDVTNRVSVAKASVETARALIGEEEATVAKRELDVRLATIEAPFDGVVVRHLLTIGGLASPEDPHILLLVDNKTPEIEAEVPLEQVSALPLGTRVEYAAADGQRHNARVRAILPANTPGDKTRFVRLEVENPAGPYNDFTPVTIYLPAS